MSETMCNQVYWILEEKDYMLIEKGEARIRNRNRDKTGIPKKGALVLSVFTFLRLKGFGQDVG